MEMHLPRFRILRQESANCSPTTEWSWTAKSSCLDKRVRPQFKNLLFHPGEPAFMVFDLLFDTSTDLRREQVTDRKQRCGLCSVTSLKMNC